MLDLLSSKKPTNSLKGPDPVQKILIECRKAFLLVVLLTVIIDLLSIIPMVYMMTMMDRVLTSKSGVTLVSLTAVVIAFYVLSLIHI